MSANNPLHFIVRGFDGEGLPCFMHEYERDNQYTFKDISLLLTRISKSHPKVIRMSVDIAIADNISPV